MSGELSREDLLREALAIASNYYGRGLELTLRQLYYRLVATGKIKENKLQNYKRLGDLISKARLAGDYPWKWLEDRTRSSKSGSYDGCWLDVSEALVDTSSDLDDAPYRHLQVRRWYGQPVHVSVWVEKEALAGVFHRPCSDWGVSSLVCRGYPSLSALYEWCVQVSNLYTDVADSSEWFVGWDQDDARDHRHSWDDMERSEQDGGGCGADVWWGDRPGIREAVILYFGDHDPDGLQIPESAVERISEVAASADLSLPPVRLVNVALTRAQILHYNPPPFYAKQSSSRFKKYVRTTGLREAWELDALDPSVLQKLINDNVRPLWNQSIRDRIDAIVDERREEMVNDQRFIDARAALVRGS